jgi:hypothetical protein
MTIQAAPKPLYNFLAHPPTPRAHPPESRPPTPVGRSITRRRSSTITAISAWVAGVLPGSPPPTSPAVPSTFSRRPSLSVAPHSAHQHSGSFTLFSDTTPAHTKVHNPELRAPTYACTVVPLPIPPSTSFPSRSPFPTERESDNGPDQMRLARLATMQQPKAAAPVTGARSPTPSKKKGLMRFLPARPRFRSAQIRPPSPHSSRPPSARAHRAPTIPSSSSPTTVAFRIAHQKRALYAQCGALPLPFDSEVAIMQFVDGGSRTDAAARLGGTFKDVAGVIYTDEEEAGECLPLLLAAESGPDDTNPPSGLPSARSGTLDGFVIPSAPPSPLSPRSIPPVSLPRSPVQVSGTSSTLALLTIPTRGGGACVPGYLHTAPPSLPLPFGDTSKTQFAPHVETMASHRKQRRRPAPLTLHLPAHTVGFEDSFAPRVVVEASTPMALEVGVAS